MRIVVGDDDNDHHLSLAALKEFRRQFKGGSDPSRAREVAAVGYLGPSVIFTFQYAPKRIATYLFLDLISLGCFCLNDMKCLMIAILLLIQMHQ